MQPITYIHTYIPQHFAMAFCLSLSLFLIGISESIYQYPTHSLLRPCYGKHKSGG